MKLTILGCGTSFGVPVIGCDCATCTSEDPRDRRTRHGAILEDGARRLLVDAPPELRLQLLAARIDRVDAVWITHCHADHIHGLDDLRAFTVRPPRRLEAWAPPDCVFQRPPLAVPRDRRTTTRSLEPVPRVGTWEVTDHEPCSGSGRLKALTPREPAPLCPV